MKYTTNIVPQKNNSINLGSVLKNFNNIYVSNITFGTNTGWLYSNNGSVGTNSPRNEILTGLSTSTNSTIVNTDNFLTAFGKLQAQIDNFSVGGANTNLSNLTSPTAINQDLLASGTRNIGNASTGIWENIYSKNFTAYNSSATPLSVERTSISPAKWDFNIGHDPLGSGSFLSSGSLSIVSQTAGTNFSIRVGNSGTSQFRVHPSQVEIVGNDSTNGYNLKINNVNANPANYISQISHSNSYQGTEYYFGGTEYAWLNVTGNSHSTPAFMQIANDINATNSRIGIRVAGQQKALFKQRTIILNPSSFTDSSTSPFMLRDDTNVSGEAFKIEGDSGKDTSFWINQPASNKYFSVGGQAGSYSMWMAYCGTSHPTQPSRAFLAFDDPNGTLGIRTDTTNKFTVTYAGNIGIGNNFYNPTSLLHLKGTNPELKIEASSNSAYFKIVSFGTNQESGLTLMNSSGEYGDIYFYGSTHSNVNLRNRMILSKATGSISLHVGTYTKLHTTVDGIAIGTDHLTPSYLLHVKHNAQTMAMFENTNTDAYVRVNSPANKTSNVIFTAGTNVADFGLTGESHGIPNVFSFYVPLNVKFRNYLNGVFHHQLSLSSTYSRFSIGLNYETSAIFGIKRMEGDTANSFNIEDSSGNNQIVVDSSGNLILGANTSTYKLYVNHGVGSADRVHIGNGTYGLFFGNASASGYSPYIYGLANTNGSPAIYWLGYSQVADDTGTNPVISLDARRVGDTAITTRPIFYLSNGGSAKLQVSASGNVTLGTTAGSGTNTLYSGAIVNSGTITNSGNILPSSSSNYNIGSSSFRFYGGYFNTISVSGVSNLATFQNTTDANVTIKSGTSDFSNLIFDPNNGTTSSISVSGASHPTQPNLFAFNHTTSGKYRYYFNTDYYSEFTATTNEIRFSLGKNLTATAMFHLKRGTTDTASYILVQNNSGDKILDLDNTGNLVLGNVSNKNFKNIYAKSYVTYTGSNGSALQINQYGANGSTFRGIEFYTGNGTLSSPTAITNGGYLASIQSFSQVSSIVGGVTSTPIASIYSKATENHSGSQAGTRWEFYTTPNGSTTQALALSLGNDKSLTLFNSLLANSTGFNLGSSSTRFANGYLQYLDVSPTNSNPSIKLNSGLSTTPTNGGLEYDSTNGFYITHNNSRKLIATGTGSSVSSNDLCFLGSFQVDINTTTDICTIDDTTTFSTLVFSQLQTGDGVAFTESSPPTNITQNTKYYIRVLSSTTFTLHPTLSDANNNTNIINIGASNLTDQTVEVREIGLRYSNYTIRTESLGITINMKPISQLSDKDTYYFYLDRNISMTLNLDSTDFSGSVRWVFLTNLEYQKSANQTITITTGSTTNSRVRVYFRSDLNSFIVEEIDRY